MIERSAIALSIGVLLVAGYMVFTRWQLARLPQGKTPDPVLKRLRPGIPAVIYFWSETCAPCVLVQKPALEKLEAELGSDSVQIIVINAVEQPKVADAWGVLGLPTTFIVDREGRPRRVNHGVVRAEHLRNQLDLVAQ